MVAKVSKLNGLKINVIGNSLTISKEINIHTNKPEFLEWKWIDLEKITDVVVDFKLEVYKILQKKIKDIIN